MYILVHKYIITLSCDIALSHDIALFCHMYLYSSNRSHPQDGLCTKISSHYLISREISFTLMEVPANYNGLSCYFVIFTLQHCLLLGVNYVYLSHCIYVHFAVT